MNRNLHDVARRGEVGDVVVRGGELGGVRYPTCGDGPRKFGVITTVRRREAAGIETQTIKNIDAATYVRFIFISGVIRVVMESVRTDVAAL